MCRRILMVLLTLAVAFAILGGRTTYAVADNQQYQRIYGSDRYATSAVISENGWQSTDAVVIARGDDFSDGLAGGPLAYKMNAPLLLTEKDNLPAEIINKIKRLRPQKAYLLGGPGAISDSIEQMLKDDYNIKVERIYGMDRYTTAAEIAKRLGAANGKAVIATGLDFPDALAAAPVAARNGWPILFANGDNLPDATLQALYTLGVKEADIIGGPGVVAESVDKQLKDMGITVHRLYGDNRELTALEIAKTYYNAPSGIVLATGYDFADALSAAPLVAKFKQPLLLCSSDTVDPNIVTYVNGTNLTIDKVTVVGGEGAVSNIAVWKLFVSDSINVHKLEVVKKNDKDCQVKLTIDYIPGAENYEVYVRPFPDSELGYKGSLPWWEKSYTQYIDDEAISPDNKTFELDLPYFPKGLSWIKIVAKDGKDGELASSNSIKVEVDAVDPETGYPIVYDEPQFWYAIEQGADVIIKTSPGDEKMERMVKAYEKAKEVLRQIIEPGMTDLQKEKAVHDYIINSTRYDYENYLNDTIPYESYEPYGVLINGVAVCQGYAETTKLLLNMAGVECMVVSGAANNSDGVYDHAWNIVKIDGGYYHLDTTWDDPVTYSGSSVLRYDYFNLSDAQMSKDHFWERAQYPACPNPGPR